MNGGVNYLPLIKTFSS